MSVRVMSLVWDNFTVGGSEKLVMLAMADWCNDTGASLHPSHDAVAKKCCISRSQAQRIIKSLTENGWISVVGNPFGGAPGTTKNYRINIEKLRETDSASATPNKSVTGSAHATGSADATGSTHAVRGVAPMRQRGSTHATQTTIEPPIEPPILNTTREKSAKFDAASDLKNRGVDQVIASDWLQLRKLKKSAVTQTAILGIEREAMKAGFTLQDALRTCCERGWAGFNAGWVQNGAGQFKTAQQQRDENNRRSTEEFLADDSPIFSSAPIEGDYSHA